VSTSSAAFACLLLPTACSLTRESNPPRTATEEFLISTAIDRAVEGLKLDIPKSTSIYLDASDFEGTDSNMRYPTSPSACSLPATGWPPSPEDPPPRYHLAPP
jgi:hypothetical protein